MIMCQSRMEMLSNIDKISIDEIYSYIHHRLARIYAAFLIINIIQVATTDEKTDYKIFLWAVIGMGLYVINVLALFFLVKQPKENRHVYHVYVPLVSTLLLAIFKILNMINQIQYGAFLWVLIVWSLFSVISVILQMMTWYVLWKLRHKMLALSYNGEHPQQSIMDQSDPISKNQV